ncbi:lactonase family protein [Pelagibacterium xiamenense]|uniref:lactonase family protein n=1 Tax=Pelagibacterium xiamenense TaxID=2901140 RepID=UPI001E437575|nr:lactonase family protein [Pelagibacterium xiamenense]MCD7058631.1 lactonase family protein [Pelagibacterium xiamenense]
MVMLAYIGTQGEGPGQGIFAVRLDGATGALESLGCVAEEERPTFALPDPARPVLYAVSEVGNRDDRHGTIMSYCIANTQGTLQPLARRRTGGGPTHITIDDAGEMLYCANFGGPEAVAVPICASGQLAPISSTQTTSGTGPHKRQTAPHPHGVTLDPSGRFLLVPDMGADRIFVYRVDGSRLAPAHPPFAAFPSGCGPRFVLFGADGRFAYMLGELSAEIFHLAWNEGVLSHLATTPMDKPDAQHTRGAAAFGLSADGRFLYASNRGTHQIHVFAIQEDTGALSEIQCIDAGGERPWGLGLSPCGRWMLVANQASDVVTVFAVAPETGLLSATGHALNVFKPTSAAFVSPVVISKLARY